MAGSYGDDKQGALTRADLLALWTSAVDPSYAEAIVQAGDGGGLEVYNQGFAQLARASQAVDVTTQAAFILPWSGQTNPSAQGEARATVELTFARTGLVDQPLRLAAGLVYAEEQTTDYGPDGAVTVLTGRRYVLTEDVVIMPGSMGPVSGMAEAEHPGWGYNNPQAGTIQVVSQVGASFYHDRATVLLDPAAALPGLPPPSYGARVVTANEMDTFVPEHLGQYVQFTAGANAGRVGRIIAFAPPDPGATPQLGSAVQIEYLAAASVSAYTPMTPGELVRIVAAGPTTIGYGSFVAKNGGVVALVLLSGTLAGATSLVGTVSGGAATVSGVLSNPTYAAEASAASWKVLDWGSDWGLTVTNAAQPVGGRLGMLDALGAERKLPRLAGELDAAYARRIHQVADVVAPNAIRRALNRAVRGYPWCLREVGSPLLPGFYFDRDAYDSDVLMLVGTLTGTFITMLEGAYLGLTYAGNNGFQERVEVRSAAGDVLVSGYYGRWEAGPTRLTLIRKSGLGAPASPYVPAAGDVAVGLSSGASLAIASVTANPYAAQYRNHVLLDYTEMRAFFEVGVPRVGFGEFGFAYDAHPLGFFDAAPYDAFWDGFPYASADFYRRAYDAVDRVRAAGVSFALYREDVGCT